MKKQKIFSLLLAAALTLQISTAALAAGNDKTLESNGATANFEITSFINLPTIKVIINEPGGVVVNPLKLPYNGSATGDSLISTPSLITNQSDVKMNITVKPSVSAPGVKIATYDPTTPLVSDVKAIAMKLYMSKASKTSGSIDASADIVGYPAKDGPDTADTNISYSGTVSVDVKEYKAASPLSATLELGAATLVDAPGTSTYTYGAYMIKGESAGKDWVKADDVSISVVFDINAVSGT